MSSEENAISDGLNVVNVVVPLTLLIQDKSPFANDYVVVGVRTLYACL